MVRPAEVSARVFPDGGMVALRSVIADSARLADWLASGGVVWTTQSIAQRDPALRDLWPHPVGEPMTGGRLTSDERDLNASLESTAIVSLTPLAATGADVLPIERDVPAQDEQLTETGLLRRDPDVGHERQLQADRACADHGNRINTGHEGHVDIVTNPPRRGLFPTLHRGGLGHPVGRT